MAQFHNRFRASWLVVLVVSMTAAGFARANDLVRFPPEALADIPAYARAFYWPPDLVNGVPEYMEIYHTDEWAAIPFYHAPECTPESANLFTFPAWEASACPATYEAVEVWRDFPESIWAYQAVFRGLGALPVWFAPWPLLQGAIADGVLTIGELEAIPGLMKGTADYYHERLAPFPLANNSQIVMIAHGHLEDGRPFSFHAVAAAGNDMNICCSSEYPRQRVEIRFR